MKPLVEHIGRLHSGNDIHDSGDAQKQEVQQEAHPDEKTRPLEAPHFAYDTADDICQREDEQTARESERTHRYLLGFKNVGSNQVYSEQQP